MEKKPQQPQLNQKQPNKDYIIGSLQQQLSKSSIERAERDAVIIEQQEKIVELEAKMEELRKEVGEKAKSTTNNKGTK